MIVTHEMNFARAICNRVFYMDQGGIYEEGTPDVTVLYNGAPFDPADTKNHLSYRVLKNVASELVYHPGSDEEGFTNTCSFVLPGWEQRESSFTIIFPEADIPHHCHNFSDVIYINL